MANTTILQLPIATAPDGSEWIEIVQGGVSRRAQLSQVVKLAPLYATAFASAAAAPANPYVGQAYFDTTLGYPRVFGGDAAWHRITLA